MAENCMYRQGGAEISLFNYLRGHINHSEKIKLVCLRRDAETLDYSKEFREVDVKYFSKLNPWFSDRFVYLSVLVFFVINVSQIIKELSQGKKIFTQNRWAGYVVLINLFKGAQRANVFVFIRDEKCIGIHNCYLSGMARALWYFRFTLEAPFRLIHDAIRKYSFRSAHVIFNSQFMYNAAKNKGYSFGSYEILHPKIERFDIELLRQHVYELGDPYYSLFLKRHKNVVMVGSEKVKGIDIFLNASKEIPELQFIVFSKSIAKYKAENGVVYLPWSQVGGLPFLLAEVCLVPSIWNEAYGRVVCEAKQFGCTIIVSNRGGLLEALSEYPDGFVAKSDSEFVSLLREFSRGK